MIKAGRQVQGKFFQPQADDNKKNKITDENIKAINTLRAKVRYIQTQNNDYCDKITKIDVDLQDDSLSTKQRDHLLMRRITLVKQVDAIKADAQIKRLSEDIIRLDKVVYGESSLERHSPSQWSAIS